jgi:hypothetical protein
VFDLIATNPRRDDRARQQRAGGVLAVYRAARDVVVAIGGVCQEQESLVGKEKVSWPTCDA